MDEDAVASALTELESMKMDVELLGSSGVGKAVNKLRKANTAHAARAKGLMDKWKALCSS